jgi:TonB family protein
MNVHKLIVAICLLAISPSTFAFGQKDPAVDDKDTKVVSFEELIYPPLARSARMQGVVVVQVKLDRQGKVTDAVGVSGSELLMLGALENVKKWQFEPNSRKNAIVVYNFKILEGRCKSDSRLFVLQGANLATVMTCPPEINTSSSRQD